MKADAKVWMLALLVFPPAKASGQSQDCPKDMTRVATAYGSFCNHFDACPKGTTRVATAYGSYCETTNTAYVNCHGMSNAVPVFSDVTGDRATGEATAHLGCGKKVEVLSETKDWTKIRVSEALNAYIANYFVAHTPPPSGLESGSSESPGLTSHDTDHPANTTSAKPGSKEQVHQSLGPAPQVAKQRPKVNWGAAIAQGLENASRTAASPRQRECLNALDVRLAELRAQGAEEQHLQALKTAGQKYCFSLQESRPQPTIPFCWQSHAGQPVGGPIYDQSEGWCVNW